MLVVELHPFERILQGLGAADIVDEHAEVGVLEVAGDEALEALLPSGVPDLQAVGLVAMDEVLDQEVDADGGLGDGAITL